MLELFDFLWKASSAKTPFSPERFLYRILNDEKFDDDENCENGVHLDHLPQERHKWQSLSP